MLEHIKTLDKNKPKASLIKIPSRIPIRPIFIKYKPG